MSEIRSAFRRPLNGPIEERTKEAQAKISFLRITMPKTNTKCRGNSGVWLYKDGEKIEAGQGTVRAGSRVHTNWDGKNLDPESVTRHRQQLKRAGFVNNTHAKGIF